MVLGEGTGNALLAVLKRVGILRSKKLVCWKGTCEGPRLLFGKKLRKKKKETHTFGEEGEGRHAKGKRQERGTLRGEKISYAMKPGP